MSIIQVKIILVVNIISKIYLKGSEYLIKVLLLKLYLDGCVKNYKLSKNILQIFM